MSFLAMLIVAMVVDAIMGDPDALWRRWPHPVVWIGALISTLDRGLNREADSFEKRRWLGAVALAMLLIMCGGFAFALEFVLRSLPGPAWFYPLASGVIASVLLAQNSLHVHVARVRAAFATGGLQAARAAVAMIVGRAPESLDEAGVARAAIETTAENFSDGVVAPVFWCVIAGLPGLVLYKAINTADSMIGHRSARHEAFGWAAARLDDVANLIPARLAGLLLAVAAPLAGGSIAQALKTMWRDAHLHKSPNAGWPEAAMAGALGLALAGPRRYGERLVVDPFLNAGGRVDATPHDIAQALKLLWGGWALMFGLVLALWWLTA